MAHLLGSKNCIESLSKDVLSMQECIQSVLDRTGQLEFASWKYPRKRASSLNMNELVEDYSYCKDEDSNRLSHIILFELVIDRFCLLLQSVGELSDSVITTKNLDEECRPKSRTVTSTMSVGLVSKLFWNKICEVLLSFHSMEKELSEYNQSLMKMENTFLELKVENEKLRKKSGKVRKKMEVVSEEQATHNTPANELNNEPIENTDRKTTFTQTFETAFLPCELCMSMQNNIVKVGDVVVNICESQSLPSSLSKQKKILRNSAMTLTDINRWSNEQERDLKKINTHLSKLTNEVDQLANARSLNLKLSNDINVITSERDELKRSITKLKEECNLCNKVIKENKKTMKLQKENLIRLEEQNKHMEEAQNQINEDLSRYKQSSHALEQGMNSMTSQLALQKQENDNLSQVQKELSETKLKLRDIEEKVKQSAVDSNKVKAENKVLLKHDQGLQTKQANLLFRLEKLDETCESLRIQLGESDEEIEKLANENTQKDAEIKQLKEETGHQSDQISELEKQLNNAVIDVSQGAFVKTERDETFKSLESCKEELNTLSQNLKLVVSYPVIGQAYDNVDKDYVAILNNRNNEIHTNGDVIKDMENQINANTARIGILDAQNYTLRNSLLKLEEANIGQTEEENSLHLLSENVSHRNRGEDIKMWSNSAPQKEIAKDPAVVPKPPSEPRVSMKLSRPWSSGKKDKKESFNIGAKLANLAKTC